MFTEGGNKLKGVLKEPYFDLDNQGNEYLFWEKFQEKLSKTTTTKQKTRFIFTGLHQNNMASTICWTSPFREARYPATIKEVVDVERSSQELTDVNKIFQIQFPPERLEIFCL